MFSRVCFPNNPSHRFLASVSLFFFHLVGFLVEIAELTTKSIFNGRFSYCVRGRDLGGGWPSVLQRLGSACIDHRFPHFSDRRFLFFQEISLWRKI